MRPVEGTCTLNWIREELTHASLPDGQPETAVINEQTIVDAPVVPGRGSRTTVTIWQAVMQRLLGGQTRGIAIESLGLTSAFLLSSGLEADRRNALLRFNVE